MQTIVRPPRRSLRAFARSRSGLAAVEFALVLPIMLVIYVGMAEVTNAVSADRKLTLLSRTLADLVARGTTISNAEMQGIFLAAASVMHPFPASEAGMSVASVRVRSSDPTRGLVCWRETSGKNPPPIDDNVQVPDGFRNPGTSYIMVRTSYAYQPAIGYALTGTVTLGEDTPWPVRAGSNGSSSNVNEVRRSSTTGGGECPASVS
jgi:Flp pilus assembly protein TadG